MALTCAGRRLSIVSPSPGRALGGGTCPATPQTQHMANVLCKNCLGTYHSPAHLHSDKLTRCPRQSRADEAAGRRWGVCTPSDLFFLTAKLEQSLSFS